MFELTGNERSPLEQLSQSRFNGRTYLQESTVSMTTSIGQILQNNPNRVFWLLVNSGANDVKVFFQRVQTGIATFILMANGGIMSMTFEEDGEAVGYELWGFAIAATSGLRLVEVIRE